MADALPAHAHGATPSSSAAAAMPSPAPTTSSIASVAGLPHPRAHALRPGSAKEDQVRNFVSDRMDHMTRRFVKKSSGIVAEGEMELDGGEPDVTGYASAAELCKDLEGVINVLWLSGTPSLQVPFLLNIASEFNTWVAGFPPSPHATFAILHKLDHCFASLLVGEDIETHEALPGFEKGLRAGLTSTDMVRCRSMAQQARLVMVEVMKGLMGAEEDGEEEGRVLGDDEVDEEAEESGVDGPPGLAKGMVDEDAADEICMEVGSVYEQTLVRLGDRLGDTLG
ncbi:hypothetical protein C8A05DRAFT_33990 [Staphylotrichum tortipilum]|uniref:Meiotic recombination protein DMC1 n=1 Tax=Staphylotrichum tortipilum TaxID=2831512 RepID=A0AAN6MM00_9PEZI|nr:hypothetical protein C8A05DRAFT_33990 [Staphylotrichum longicolle]